MDYAIIILVLILGASNHWAFGRIRDLETVLKHRELDAKFYRRQWVRKGTQRSKS